MIKYKFSDAPEEGEHIIESGYTKLVIIDQIADVDENEPNQVALAEEYGGEPIIVNVVEKKQPQQKATNAKSAKKPAKSEPKN